MANLVDGYKNMISGGVRIRDGVVNVPNSSNPVEPLYMYEGLVCYHMRSEESSPTNYLLYFSELLSMSVLCFCFPTPRSSFGVGDPSSLNYKQQLMFRDVSSQTLDLYEYAYWNGPASNEFFAYKSYHWLVLRIA